MKWEWRQIQSQQIICQQFLTILNAHYASISRVYLVSDIASDGFPPAEHMRHILTKVGRKE